MSGMRHSVTACYMLQNARCGGRNLMEAPLCFGTQRPCNQVHCVLVVTVSTTTVGRVLYYWLLVVVAWGDEALSVQSGLSAVPRVATAYNG